MVQKRGFFNSGVLLKFFFPRAQSLLNVRDWSNVGGNHEISSKCATLGSGDL